MHNNDSNIIANDLPARINNFVGREEVLSKINEILSTNQVVVINAFAGTGKSSTALEYGHLQSKAGKIVRWFNADSADKIKENYKQLASDLGIDITHIDTEQQQKILVNSVNNALAKLGKPMLLIFDELVSSVS
jgi:ATP/maltotriose-dependent transcriptional regulator MalT